MVTKAFGTNAMEECANSALPDDQKLAFCAVPKMHAQRPLIYKGRPFAPKPVGHEGSYRKTSHCKFRAQIDTLAAVKVPVLLKSRRKHKCFRQLPRVHYRYQRIKPKQLFARSCLL